MARLTAGQTELRQIERSRQLAAALQQMATSFEPITHPYQGLAKMAQAYLAGKMMRKSNTREDEIAEEEKQAMLAALGPQYATIPAVKPQGDGTVPAGDTLGVIQGYDPRMGQFPVVGTGGGLGPVGFQGERQIETAPGLPQRQIDQIMALPEDVRATVVGNYIQSQLIPDTQTPQKAEVFAEVGDNGYLTNHTAAVPGTAKYDRLVADPKMVPVQKPSGIERIEQGGPGEFGGMTDQALSGQQVEINDQVAAMNTFAKMSERVLGILYETPGANTLTARVANVGNRVMQEVKTVGNELGIYIVDENNVRLGERGWDIRHYEDVFRATGLAGQSPRIKNGFLAMAIQRAMASGLGTGRALSDYDIKNQLATLGVNQSDPDIVATLFADSYMNLRDYTLEKYAPYKGQLTLPKLYTPSYVNIIPVEQLPGWDELDEQKKDWFRRTYPNGYRMR